MTGQQTDEVRSWEKPRHPNFPSDMETSLKEKARCVRSGQRQAGVYGGVASEAKGRLDILGGRRGGNQGVHEPDATTAWLIRAAKCC